MAGIALQVDERLLSLNGITGSEKMPSRLKLSDWRLRFRFATPVQK
jgi:hypothetical protein